jgi:hypothetical protein
VAGQPQIEIGLQARPQFRAGAEIPRQPQGGIRRNAALFQNDFIDPARREVQRPRQRVLGQATGQHKFFPENLVAEKTKGDEF